MVNVVSICRYFGLILLYLSINACSDAIEQVSKPDVQAPVTSITPKGSLYNHPVNVSLSCQDASAGCQKILYAIGANSNGFSEYSVPLTLDSSTTIQFYAIDRLGNTENLQSETYIIDTTLPEAASALSFTSVSANALSVGWNKATDNVNSALQYKLFYATTDSLDSVEEVLTNGVPVGDFTPDFTTANVTGLQNAMLYYWNVVVRDLAGNMATYTKAAQGTLALGTLVSMEPLRTLSTADEEVGPYGNFVALVSNNVVITPGKRFDVDKGNLQDSVISGSAVVVDNNQFIYSLVGNSVNRYHMSSLQLDNSFGVNGSALLHNPLGKEADLWCVDIAINITKSTNGLDDKHNIIIACIVYVLAQDQINPNPASFSDVILFRLHPSGIIDDSVFGVSSGTNGYMLLTKSASGSGFNRPYALTRDNNGQILLTGESYNGLDSDMLIWRLNGSDGSLDTMFGSNGKYIYTSPGDSRGRALVVEQSGKILIAGETWTNTSKDMALWRYDPSPGINALDSGFGKGGIVTHNSAAAGNGQDRAYDIALDNGGNIVVSGASMNSAGDFDMVAWRFDAKGVLDQNFGNMGIVVYDSSTSQNKFQDSGRAIIVNQAGQVFVAGNNLWVYQ